MSAPTTLGDLVTAAAPEDPCALSDDAGTNYSLRIAALFAIMVASFLGGSLPLVTRSTNLDSAFFFGTVFAGGVVVATGFVHILPDAAEAMSNPCLHFSTEYPWAFVFAGGAALMTFLIEYFLKIFIRSKLGLPPSSAMIGHGHGADVDIETPTAPANEFSTEDPKKQLQDAQMAENRVAAIMLESGVIFHSIFIGIDLGINSDASVVRPLMIALMFHQGFEGLALGSTFIRAKFSNLKYILFLVAFVLVTPIGIAIGLGVGSSYNSNGTVALGFEAAFNSVSAGILIYNGFVDLLLPTFMEAKLLTGRPVMQLAAMACMFAGYSCMSLLAKWA